MNIISRIKEVLFADNLQKPTAKKRFTPQISRPQPYRVDVDLAKLKEAVSMAKNPDSPNRYLLYTLYDEILQDSHLAAQIRTAKLTVTKSEFELQKKGKPDETASELLKVPWFDDFISYTLDSEFFGHSLIEFGLLNEDKQFEQVNLIPRRNVKQEKGLVVPDPTEDDGIIYRDNLTEWFLIETGGRYDLGLLEQATREVLIKNYARSDWSQASEKYGMPLLKIKTSTQDPKEVDRVEAMAQDFAQNGYVIINNEDDVEITQIKETDFYKIYLENISHSNENISKLINGQTGTSDEKSYVGSANVHERILNDYTFSRMRKLQYIINHQLLPFLIHYGYPLKDYTFVFPELTKVETGNNKPQKLSLSDTDFS
ncbi:MAG: DUF935 family protein [Bacteroidota bacterium]|nr:DUF935 family protein [Bacteroidota bacterium]